MTIIGVDPSVTSTGVAVDHDGEVTLSQIEPGKLKPPLTGLGRLVYITGEILEACIGGPDVLLVIEGPGRQQGYGIVNVALHWMIRRELAFGAPTLQTLVVPPATLKKFVTDDGRAGKSEVGQGIKDRWGDEYEGTLQEDVAEAFALMHVGRCWLGQGKFLQKQKGCLQKLAVEEDGQSRIAGMEAYFGNLREWAGAPEKPRDSATEAQGQATERRA